eukprot:SAG31_NODE_36844_length_309_cov_1.976190_1_plen_45_part_01
MASLAFAAFAAFAFFRASALAEGDIFVAEVGVDFAKEEDPQPNQL